ncbi:patatin-like protein [Tistrella mobilis]|uniref:patatin-like protein n=1 Tax=Tistrella mobilis TaxID=171437 RepID=UPI003558B6B9
MTDTVPCRELRLGIVLYGGVSLAIYMAGITEELHALLRASRDRASSTPPPAKAPDPAPTSAIYRDLLDELAEKTVDLRVVVDTIAGSSAGGLNGAVLGRAIATGGGVRHMNGFWIDKADIAVLRMAPSRRLAWCIRGFLSLALLSPKFKKFKISDAIDRSWLFDHAWSFFKSQTTENTPLDGQKFTRMIHDALRGISGNQKLLPDGQQLDLFLTRTDLHGWPVHLPVDQRLHAGIQRERCYPHLMNFTIRHGCQNDFDDLFALTYACRTTASFPIAFAPVRITDVVLPPDSQVPENFPHRHMAGHLAAGDETTSGSNWANMADMADGGLHNNKPFRPVIDAIRHKPAKREVSRMLMYVEPLPEKDVPPPPQSPPHGLKLIERIYNHFRYEPILNDLASVAEENRISEELAEFERDSVAAALNFRSKNPKGTLADFSPAVVRGYERYEAYRGAMRVAQTINQHLGWPHGSPRAYLVRRLAEAYRIGQPQIPAQLWFIAYRSDVHDGGDVLDRVDRRRRFLVRAANQRYRISSHDRADVDRFKAALFPLAGVRITISTVDYDHIEKLAALETNDINSLIILLLNPQEGEQVAEKLNELQLSNAFPHLFNSISRSAKDEANKIDEGLHEAIATIKDTTFGKEISAENGVFGLVDPLVSTEYGRHGIEEPQAVRVVRMSPADCPYLRDHSRCCDMHNRSRSRDMCNCPQSRDITPLGGGLGAFAGFLSYDARIHDILLGRLNGAERLLDVILDAAGLNQGAAEGLKKHYLSRLFDAIARDLIANVGKQSGLGKPATQLLQQLKLLAP